MENTSQTKIMYRVYFMAIGLLLFALTLVGKLFYIQWVQGDFYTSKLEASTLKSVVLEASRGNIYADDGSILATTVPRYELRWDAMVVSKSLFEEKKTRISSFLGDFERTFQKLLSKTSAKCAYSKESLFFNRKKSDLF